MSTADRLFDAPAHIVIGAWFGVVFCWARLVDARLARQFAGDES